ncbi:hypothetical protein NBM05_03840 [Rothia sp. AR01]|uniref:Uncharacterized protein n=1 Tax=Rothia santali TaxID=2949643 RepID=A0A9X2HBR5_9MICC|nr:hypothetical protein [Rothia santali]MCP3425180.1 hypothetical protein [Rothia santali]
MHTDTASSVTGASDWIVGPQQPAAEPADESSAPPVIIGVSPEAGARTWAQLLGLKETTISECSSHPVILVARSTLKSLAACIEAIQELAKTEELITGILVVPDAPGTLPKPVQHRIRVLQGAHPVHLVAWVPALRGIELTEDLAQHKTVAKARERVAKFIETRTVTTLP